MDTDVQQTDEQAIRAAAAHDGPVYVRLSRMPVPELDRARPHFAIGRGEVLREGGDIAIIANGTMVHRALDAAKALVGEGVSARVVNMACVSPIDRDLIAAAAATGGIVTVEEGLKQGGLGGAVAEFCAEHTPVPMRILGFPGFVPTGSAAWLMDEFGLNADGIASAARELLAGRG